jgi:hypothetical protein
MTNTTVDTSPLDADPTTVQTAPAPAEQTARVQATTRSLATPAIVGIAVGGVLLAGLLFGGGIAVGLALPVVGHTLVGGIAPDGHGVPPRGDGPAGGDGTRPTLPDGDSGRPAPVGPDSRTRPGTGADGSDETPQTDADQD